MVTIIKQRSGEASGEYDVDEESFEEVVVDDDDDDDSEEEIERGGELNEEKSGKESEGGKIESKKEEVHDSENEESDNDSEGGRGKGEEEEEKDGRNPPPTLYDLNSKALKAKTEELLASKKGFPWVERFDVVPTTPLPFGKPDNETGMIVDVHDDLKREVAFYDLSKEAVEIARSQCKKIGLPFSRPDDFFAEMVKSDDHMARVKDRLIFENKKIEAVAQRKSNREQKLRAKESHSNKLAEKSRRRKENLKAVDDWAQSAASNRGGRYGDKDDQAFLKKLSPQAGSAGRKRGAADRGETGPNRKRMAADKKYGHGGKSPRFKQNTQAEINDMSRFNPKGNFGGLGSKKKGGSGANRKGKRARDAGRSHRS